MPQSPISYLTVTDSAGTTGHNVSTLEVTGAGVSLSIQDRKATVTVPGGGGGGSFTTTVVPLSSAQLESTSPILAIDAPGAGKAIIPVAIAYQYNFGTTEYTTAGSFAGLFYGTSTVYLFDNGDGSIFAKEQSSFIMNNLLLGFLIALSGVDNQAVYYIQDPAGSYTGGDGTGVITIIWTTIDV
jgi:hypothetical protein